MQVLAVFACSREPGGNGGRAVTEDAFSGTKVYPFGHSHQDLPYLVGRSFEAVEGRLSSGGKGSFTSLTFESLNRFGLTVPPISDESVAILVADTEILA